MRKLCPFLKYLLSNFLLITAFVVCFTFPKAQASNADSISLQFPNLIVKNLAHTIDVKSYGEYAKYREYTIHVKSNDLDTSFSVQCMGGKGSFDFTFQSKDEYTFTCNSQITKISVNPIPLWLSILPPLIAILMAFLFGEVFTAIFSGLFFGTFCIAFFQYSNVFSAISNGFFRIIDTYIINSLLNKGHISIIVFSMLIGGTVSLITANGGMQGIVNKLVRYANNRYSGQFITWLLGILIFFDDYANTLVVGYTMRPVTDRLKISREKLAYLVDSTAAPIASIAFITTWIGAELSYIEDGLQAISLDMSSYEIFIKSLAYSFYPFFALCFILLIIFFRRDFGPMRKAEILCNAGKPSAGYQEIEKETVLYEGKKARWFNAVIPVIVIVVGAVVGLFYTGWDNEVWNSSQSFITKTSKIIGQSNSFLALLWSSFLGLLCALILTISQKILSLKDSIKGVINGFKVMLNAILILTFAWSLALLTKHMHTADFITQLFTQTQIHPFLIPAITFVISGLVSFSTGSSWGTMAILYPLILPASWIITQNAGFEHNECLSIFTHVASAVLAGSVFGDHCSPISDTTIMSSLASSCNHIEHVRTQLPYALLVGIISIFAGTFPSSFGFSPFLLFPAGLILLFIFIMLFGKKIE